MDDRELSSKIACTWTSGGVQGEAVWHKHHMCMSRTENKKASQHSILRSWLFWGLIEGSEEEGL
jgi:hypothetical protein